LMRLLHQCPCIVSRHCRLCSPCPLLCVVLPSTAPPEIYPLSLHDALPILPAYTLGSQQTDLFQRIHRQLMIRIRTKGGRYAGTGDRKSTRLNSSHVSISYAVFCLKKKKRKDTTLQMQRRLRDLTRRTKHSP